LFLLIENADIRQKYLYRHSLANNGALFYHQKKEAHDRSGRRRKQ